MLAAATSTRTRPGNVISIRHIALLMPLSRGLYLPYRMYRTDYNYR